MLEAQGKVRVLYADTDQMGQAYYGTYLTWFEVGRAAWFRLRGMSYRALEEQGYYLPVVEAYCRYLRPAHYDDMLVVQTTASMPSAARVRFDYRIVRDGQVAQGSRGEDPLAEGYTIHVFMNASKRPTKPPSFFRHLFTTSHGDH